MNRKLKDTELSQVCDVIASRTGLHFPIEKWALLRRNLALAAREFGFHDMSGFLEWFLSAAPDKNQIEILASYLTNSETYFWREPKVFTALTDSVLPELIRSKKKGEKSIRIWSAGCSTGEEPYSIAIALHRTIQKIEDWNITILATDINPGALSKAVSGIYSAWSFRNSPSWLKSTWFHNKENRKYEIIPEIKKMVTFACLNLVEMSAFTNTNTMDIIFCRNVLMYFTNEWAGKISHKLFHSLSERGWLIISSYELSSQLFPGLTAVNFPGAIMYRKTKKESTISYNILPDEIPEPHLSPVALLTTEASAKVVANKSLQTLQPFKPTTFTRHSHGVSGQSTLQSLSSNPSAKEESATNLKSPEKYITDTIITIRLLAGQGHPEEALSICNKAIASDKLAPGLYFLRSSILQELNRNHEAIKSLKQAIYIDPGYIMGHFTLGNLFIREGDARNAKRSFNNVLDLISRCENTDILPESEGLSVTFIRKIILANMQIQPIK